MTHAAAEIHGRSARLTERLAGLAAGVRTPRPVREGRIVRMVGMKLEAEGCDGAIGERCRVTSEQATVDAEIVGFAEGRLVLMPEGEVMGLQLGARVRPLGEHASVAVGEALLGRVIDGAGHYLDGAPPAACDHSVPLRARALNPLQRRPIRDTLDTGVRVINGLTTLGKGQRLGLFAGSGVGKSTLLGMMTRYAEADVIVVATPADHPPLMRIHGAWRATAIAEHFRAEGKDVLLLMDSLTRFAQAQREMGLAVGEPPVAKGYPPSVFSLLPNLVERAGNGERGSITGIYTVLVEGDDQADPIADAARAILDGHIVLSRREAESGLFPAVDIEASVSRLMVHLADPAQRALARSLRELYSVYAQNRDLINIGAYEQGSDPTIDRAIRAREALRAFVRQDQDARVSMDDTRRDLRALASIAGIDQQAGGIA
jgi:flagellum-specific ATP synthase